MDIQKEFFSVYDNASATLGAFAPYNTDNLPDFDRLCYSIWFNRLFSNR